MSSGSSTEPQKAPADAGLQPWHFYLLLSMAAAIWAVVVARDTHPASLLLLSGAALAAGLAGAAMHHALTGFFGTRTAPAGPRLGQRTRDALASEKALVLRSLKELEFDRAMRKVSDADFAEIGSRLRARAMEVMRDLDRTDALPPPAAVDTPGLTPFAASPPVPGTVFAPLGQADAAPPLCGTCGQENDPDARFCNQCGSRLA
jgi:hypothetical protein